MFTGPSRYFSTCSVFVKTELPPGRSRRIARHAPGRCATLCSSPICRSVPIRWPGRGGRSRESPICSRAVRPPRRRLNFSLPKPPVRSVPACSISSASTTTTRFSATFSGFRRSAISNSPAEVCTGISWTGSRASGGTGTSFLKASAHFARTTRGRFRARES